MSWVLLSPCRRSSVRMDVLCSVWITKLYFCDAFAAHTNFFFFFKVAKTSEEALKLFVSVWCNKHRMWSPSWGFRCYWVFSCFMLPCACGSSRCLSALLCFLSLRDTLLLSEDHRGPDGFWMDCFMTVSPLIFAAKVAAEDREGGGGSYRGGGAIKATLKRRRTDL